MLNAVLNQVVTSGDSMHTQLYDRDPRDIEVLEGISSLLKLKLKDKSPPCTITITGVSNVQKNFIQCFISDEHRIPCEQNSTAHEVNLQTQLAPGEIGKRSKAKSCKIVFQGVRVSRGF